MAKKQTAKDIMLAHSAAKVEYYQKYLTCYLSIMSVTRKIDEVNIFDVFWNATGTGTCHPTRTKPKKIKTNNKF